jgi:methyl-accepting chemotaxis protein
MSWFHRNGLRSALFLSFLAALAVAMVPAYHAVREAMRDDLDARGSALARALAQPGPAPFQSERAAREALELLAPIPEGEGFAMLVRPDFSVVAAAPRVDPGDAALVLSQFRAHGLPLGVEGVSLGRNRLLWSWPARERRVEDPEGPNAGAPVGYAVVVLSEAPTSPGKNSVPAVMAGALGLSIAVFAALLVLVSRAFVGRPLAEMAGVAQGLGDGDLTQRSAPLAEGDLAKLGAALNRAGETFRVTLSKVKAASEGIGAVIERISSSSESVACGAATTVQSVDETSSSMEEMIASLKGIAENVEVLAQSAEESSSSILQMAATNDEVAENVIGLSASVEQTTSAIEKMTFSIKEVAKNIEELSATAGETSSSMNQMDVSIDQVETNANETAKLSELVSQDADKGVLALQKTLVGIDRIKLSSKQAAEVIESLGKKISTIGNILNVIDDVAEQTNLLALNAAIIAAQAGEHGRGFAVVADEIKDLAERTGASTKEISQLIRSVQDESKNAIEAMERGVKSVDEGVRLGGEAEGALKKISDSSSKATQMVKAIARATVEQSRGSKQVTNAINRIDQTVQQIALATAELARGSEQIMKSAEMMRSITKHVERSSQEQSRGSKQITRSIESINDMVNHLNRAQKEQTKGSEQVMKAVESIKGVADQQNRSMGELERAIDGLEKEAEVLRDEVGRFKV